MGNVEHICAPLTGWFRYIAARSAGGNFKELNFMSYTDMQYANPGWTNGTPPPLNASNLNDISNALQAVNITQQERTTLGAEATDTLGQILAALKTTTDGSIESISQDVEEIQQTMGNVKCVYGTYVGNGNATARVHTTGLPYFLIVSGIGDGDNDPDGTSLVVCRNAPSFRTMSGPMVVAVDAETIVWQDKQVYWKGPNAARILNRSGVTYYYIYAV